MGFARLIGIPAAHEDGAQLQTPSLSSPTVKPPQDCTPCIPLSCGPCWVHVCLSMDVPKPLSFVLPVLEMESKLIFLEAVAQPR